MDLSVTRDTVRVSEPLFDGVSDHPVDCDVILPDYCPDIARILKTEGAAVVDSKTVDPGRLTVGGTFRVTVMYIPENSSSVRCVTHETPFSHVFDLRETQGNPLSRAFARVAFVNCRPISPRRLQIRGSLAVGAKVWVENEENFISDVSDDRIELLRKPLTALSVLGESDKRFDVADELEIGYGKPAAAAIIKADAVAVLQDCKIIRNKVIAKGEVLLKTLYAPESEDEQTRLEVMEHTIPLSQIIDLDGVDEDCGCDVHFSVGYAKVEIKADSDGENRLFAVELPITANARAYRTNECFAVTDAYSTQYDLEIKKTPVTFEHIIDTLKNSEMIRQTVELENANISSVTDASVQAAVTNCRFDGPRLEISGDLNVSIIAADDAGGPACFEKTLPFSIREELKKTAESMRCEPEISVLSSGYSLSGSDRIDLRVEIAVEAVLYGAANETAVTELNLDDSKPKECVPGKTLTIYYAEKGESVWEIAKRYNTSVDAVKRENSLENDELEERSMLLIPKKRCPRK